MISARRWGQLSGWSFMSTDTIIIDPHYCGPRAMANGGYAAGRFASAIDGSAEITLRAPVRFNTPIAFEPDEAGKGRFRIVAGGAEIAAVRPGAVTIDLPPVPPEASIEAARQAYLDDDGMTLVYPYCFVCGKRRDAHDGLCIFAGAAPDSPVNADHWTPAEHLAGDDGLVRPEFLWAALDCPSAFALRMGDRPVLLGRLAGDIRRRPKPGERLIAMAWKTASEGRKHFSDSALVDANGEVIAAANALWIELNDPKFLAKLREENE